MAVRNDPLIDTQTLERVFYATGMMLDAQDFQDEQAYHRGRIARALLNLHGYGTVSGLKVTYSQTPAPGGSPAQPVEQIQVDPGLAVDRLGRLIEVPGQACLRLDRWYRSMAESSVPAEVGSLISAFHELPTAGIKEVSDPPFVGVLTSNEMKNGGANAAPGVVVLDLFIRFIACEAGKTPTFACGPFDALDAVQPSRLRDGYELILVPRPEPDLTAALPLNPWATAASQPNPSSRRQALFDRILDPTLFPVGEYVTSQEDQTAVLLARIAIQAAPSANNEAPTRPDPIPADPARAVYVNNYLRPFLFTTQAVWTFLGV